MVNRQVGKIFLNLQLKWSSYCLCVYALKLHVFIPCALQVVLAIGDLQTAVHHVGDVSGTRGRGRGTDADLQRDAPVATRLQTTPAAQTRRRSGRGQTLTGSGYVFLCLTPDLCHCNKASILCFELSLFN